MAASERTERNGSSDRLPPLPDWPRESLMVTFAFHCNIACKFCMVEDVLTVLPGTSLEEFRAAAAEPGKLDGVSRIIFSGGEVTLSKQLPAYAELARSLPGVEHVRIQTNATRLAKRDYLRELIAAGIDEYFVSFHAPDAELYDALVQRPGAFDKILDGLGNIADEPGATFTTNTAIVADNHDRLEAIVDRVVPFGPESMEFWNYWPRGDDDAGRHMSASISASRAPLIRAAERLLSAGVPPVFKWFPRCLLGPLARYADDSQPPALIDSRYWEQEPAYSCIYEGVCGDYGRGCSGLSHSYVYQHGWEESLLAPRRVEDPGEGSNAGRVETRSLVKDVGEKRSHAAAVEAWLDEVGLQLGVEVAGYRLSKAELGRGAAMLVLEWQREDATIEVRVQPRDERRPAFARTPSFNLIYARVDRDREAHAQQLAGLVAERIGAHDDGYRGLPG